MKINTRTLHVQLDPHDPDFYADPYPYYDELRQKAPLFYWEDFGLWTFTRHEDVSAILRDRRFGRQILHVTGRETLGWPPERADLKPFNDVERHSLLELEPPDHTRLRGLVHKAFTHRQIERLRTRIATLTHELIDGMLAKGTADLLVDFATPIPVTVIAEMLGVPTSMNAQLLAWSHAMVGMYQLARTPAQEQAAVTAAQAFAEFLREYVGYRRQRPQDDLLSHLLVVEAAGDRLTEDELISTCILLLNAGHEATVNVIGNGVYALLNHPAQWAQWRTNPAITKTAVEELLRFDTPLHQFNRWTLVDVDYNGHHFPMGTQVALLLGSANRDERIFARANQLDLLRQPNPHVSFGGGIHYCLGAPLARLELQIALPILLHRLPRLHLVGTPRLADTFHFHAFEALWVRW